ncbi:ABC-three component system protein [Ruminiclostridium cellobioparum]|uniref:ABC-three component systems C-terminal domain-containing protein n=1 Tax=Ruminiclostridium cellobioparum subsp. termitidis CT1112 TaxID=1195236 RepID=S0FI28_RUMCE|nr:ABC-three component system protein [Ruminiclostridium cellobioparum]EMS71232.1 hypothetical protein CTER_2885 [Ruminiclostridium cellobioparum subsp. termitidis CT1112]
MGDIREPNLRDVNLYRLIYGIQLTPQQIISTFDDKLYEEFISCWLIDCVSKSYNELDRKYEEIGHLGGAGDKGRDVVAIVNMDDGTWDNYQCKHYKGSLAPVDIYCEIGKVIYYTYKKEYTIPRSYYFVAPKNIGTKLNDMLNNPDELRKNLVENWDSYCKDNITKKEKIKLEGEIEEYINNFDFSIFKGKGTAAILSEFEKSRFYPAFFGGGFSKPRPLDRIPERAIQPNEDIYIKRLIEAYSDALGFKINGINELEKYTKEYTHFKDQRICFYKAESLKDYANESLPSEEIYDEFKSIIHDAIIDTINDDYDNGYVCIKETLKEVQRIDLSCNILGQVTRPADRKGVCHQLANEEKVRWVKQDGE